MSAAMQTYSIQQIKDMLTDRVHEVAYHYAPPCAQSYEDRDTYFTLNPGRPDKSVGSFYIYLSGPKRGTWRDHSTGGYGDLLDLIALSLYCDVRDAIKEARSFLGLQTDSPEDSRRREEAMARAKEDRKRAEAAAKEQKVKRAGMARRLIASAVADIEGTPAMAYLRDVRRIDFARLGRVPGSLLYHPECYYKHVDPGTKETVEGKYPAMLARVIDRKGKTVACHRTYLAQRPDGTWDKAPVPKAKKVLGDYSGACIRVWSGLGPRGGKGAPLAQCPPGTHVLISEGIEDALSGAMLWPEARFIAAISLSNLGMVELPENVTRITLIADRDEGEQQQFALSRAGQLLRATGRKVHIWQNADGGKDLNDALRAELEGADHDD